MKYSHKKLLSSKKSLTQCGSFVRIVLENYSPIAVYGVILLFFRSSSGIRQIQLLKTHLCQKFGNQVSCQSDHFPTQRARVCAIVRERTRVSLKVRVGVWLRVRDRIRVSFSVSFMVKGYGLGLGFTTKTDENLRE